MSPEDRDFLSELFEAAVGAADPKLALRARLPQRPRGRTVVVGAGKGAASWRRHSRAYGTARSKASSSPATAMPFPAIGYE